MTGSRTLLLVGTERHAELSLARADARSVRSLRAFVRDAAEELLDGESFATPETTTVAVVSALHRLHEEGRLGSFRDPAARLALAHSTSAAVGRLHRSGVEAEHLERSDRATLRLLGGVMRIADELLRAAGLVDARRAGWIVVERLPRRHLALLGGIESVAVSGVLAFEPDDCALLEVVHAALRARGGSGVTVTLPRLSGLAAGTSGGAAFVLGAEAISSTADELERRWSSLDDPPDIAWHAPDFIADGAREPSAVVVAEDAEGEVRAAALAIRRALARGTSPERIAVAVPTLAEALLEPLRAALDDANIPYSEPRGRPIARCPEGRIAFVLLALAAGPLTRDDVMELLRAPFVHTGHWMEKASDREASARAALLAHRLRDVPVDVDRTGRLLVQGLSRLLEERPDERWMVRALERVLGSITWLGEGVGRAEIGQRLLTLLDALKLGKPSARELGNALAQEAKGSFSTVRALGEGAAVARVLREAVGALSAASATLGLADDRTPLSQFSVELERGLAGIGSGAMATGARAGSVRIARTSDLAGFEHDLLVVMGLEEGAFQADEESGLLDDRLRRELPMGHRSTSGFDRAGLRLAELSLALGGAKSSMLSYARGNESEPAPAHEIIRRALGRNVPNRREPPSRVAVRASLADARAEELWRTVRGAPPGADIAARAAVERTRTSFFLDPFAVAGPFSGRVLGLGETGLAPRVGGDLPERTIAVTSIESAAQCAFAGFCKRVLHARRRDDLGEAADARERGTLVHRALHAAFEAATRVVGTRPEEILGAARAAAELALGVSAALAPLRREAVDQAVSDATAAVASAVLGIDALRFAGAEKRFGKGEAPPWGALELASPDGPSVFVDGQIDRFDVSSDGQRARVVDYKTGIQTPSDAEHGKTAFQLLLYASVVERALGSRSIETSYVVVRPRGLVFPWPRKPGDAQKLASRRKDAEEAARKVVLRLWEGDVAPRPVRATLCARCDVRDVCRRPAVAPPSEEERS